MGFRRIQKAQIKKRPKNKVDQHEEQNSREWKKADKAFKKYKKIKWSDEITEA